MTANPLLFVAVTLTLGVILVNGWTDAPNAIATCVVTRCMSPKAAILMAAVFNFLGVFVMTKISSEVTETVTKMVNFGENEEKTIIIVLCAAMLAKAAGISSAQISEAIKTFRGLPHRLQFVAKHKKITLIITVI